jgi:hypothetical protein
MAAELLQKSFTSDNDTAVAADFSRLMNSAAQPYGEHLREQQATATATTQASSFSKMSGNQQQLEQPQTAAVCQPTVNRSSVAIDAANMAALPRVGVETPEHTMVSHSNHLFLGSSEEQEFLKLLEEEEEVTMTGKQLVIMQSARACCAQHIVARCI